MPRRQSKEMRKTSDLLSNFDDHYAAVRPSAEMISVQVPDIADQSDNRSHRADRDDGARSLFASYGTQVTGGGDSQLQATAAIESTSPVADRQAHSSIDKPGRGLTSRGRLEAKHVILAFVAIVHSAYMCVAHVHRHHERR